MKIYKVLDHVEYPVTKQVGEGFIEEMVHIFECYGLESDDDWEYSQFTIHTDFPQAYRIMQHMKKPTIEPFKVEVIEV